MGQEEQEQEPSSEQSRILVVQQGESGKAKIEGIKQHGAKRFALATWTVSSDLPRILDETEAYLPRKLDADLVLDFSGHPDVSQDLIQMCRESRIPVVAPGKKEGLSWAHTPPI